MVRMLGIVSISFSCPFDDGIRLTHSAGCGAKREVNARRVRGRQPALAASHACGSRSPPLTHTSKWRWLAVERPVLPT